MRLQDIDKQISPGYKKDTDLGTFKTIHFAGFIVGNNEDFILCKIDVDVEEFTVTVHFYCKYALNSSKCIDFTA